MSASYTAVNYTDHGHLKIAPSRKYSHVAKEQIVPLIVHEFSLASAEMPIVFVKNKDTGEFQSVALLGFAQGENVFNGAEKWRGTYVPAVVTHHPFALMPTEQEEHQYQVVIIEPNDATNETEGEALFNDDGQESEYMIKRKNALGQYFENTMITQTFLKHLAEKELFIEQSLSLDFNGQKLNIGGLYLIDEQKLKALSDQDYLELRERGYIGPIYSHLNSIHQLHNLARLKASA
jgi:hypothetical protein